MSDEEREREIERARERERERRERERERESPPTDMPGVAAASRVRSAGGRCLV